MKVPGLNTAMLVYYAGNRFSISDDDYDTLEWYEETPKPTLEEIQSKIASAEVIHHNNIVNDQRKTAYEQTSDPIFFKWQRNEATQEEWLTAVQEVKNQYPKRTL